MNNIHCIILCGGKNTRWAGHQGVSRKHLVELEGETLLQRTIQQVSAREPARVVIVVNRGDTELYRSALSLPTEFYEVDGDTPGKTEAQKFLSSKELWNTQGQTIILMGDVWFSVDAIEKIFNLRSRDWTAFGRIGASKYSGCPYGELFAQSFTDFKLHEAKLLQLDSMYKDGSCIRIGSGWAHYQLMIGADPNRHTVGPSFIQINDFTEDIDSPEDLEGWLRGRSEFRGQRKDSGAL